MSNCSNRPQEARVRGHAQASPSPCNVLFATSALFPYVVWVVTDPSLPLRPARQIAIKGLCPQINSCCNIHIVARVFLVLLEAKEAPIIVAEEAPIPVNHFKSELWIFCKWVHSTLIKVFDQIGDPLSSFMLNGSAGLTPSAQSMFRNLCSWSRE